MKKQLTLKDLANYYATDRDGAKFTMKRKHYEFVTLATDKRALYIQSIAVLYDFRRKSISPLTYATINAPRTL